MHSPTRPCPSCHADMALEVCVPSMSEPGRNVWFFSCGCGRVVSEMHDRSDKQPARGSARAVASAKMAKA